MGKLNFKSNKKSNKTNLIIAKIHELAENDYGDPARLQMIQTYLEENVPLDQTDTLYLKKICKEYAQVAINERKLSTPSAKNDESKEQLILSDEKVNQLVTEKKQPFKKFINILERKIKNKNLESKKIVTKNNIKKNLINEVTPSDFNKNEESKNDQINSHTNSSNQNSKPINDFTTQNLDSDNNQNLDVSRLANENNNHFSENFDQYSNNLNQFQNQQKLELDDIARIIEDVKTKKNLLLSEVDKIHSFKKNIEKVLLQYDETQMKLDYVRSDLDSIQLTVSKKLSEVLRLQKDLVFLKDKLTSLNP